MNKQIEWIASLLNTHDIPYWLDSGSLLGLMRDGDLRPEMDIDIGMWERNESQLRKMLPIIHGSGYTISVDSYQDMIHRYKFVPRAKSNRTIDIKLFRGHADNAWSPDFFDTNPYRRGTVLYYHYYVSRFRLLSVHLAVLMLLRRWLTVHESVWPWRLIYGVGTWWIPRVYFDDISLDRDLGVLVPSDWEGYLEFRYGNWKTPVREWCWYRDDRAFQRKPPHDLIPQNSVGGLRS
jgi:hypothetical protein